MANDSITEFLGSVLDEYLRDLEALVNIDSGTHNKAGVNAVGSRMERWLQDIGAQVDRIPGERYGDSVVGRLRGNGGRKVVMVGHMDTVHPDGSAAERPFRMEVDRAYGPGSADMKAGILSGLYGIKAIQHLDRDDFGEVVLFLNPDEEVGSPSSTDAIDDECRDADAAIVLEGCLVDGSVVVGRKGVFDYTLTVHGRNAHAGVEPEKGRSAILELADKVVKLSELSGLSEGTTVNVGTIRGGTKPNVVPDYATCEIDVRIKTVQAQEIIDREVRRIAGEQRVPDTRVELESRNHFPPMERNEQNEQLFEIASQIGTDLGLRLTAAESGGGSDANHISALGIPVLDGLGPRGDGKHTTDEHLYISSIVERTSLLTHLLLRLAQ